METLTGKRVPYLFIGAAIAESGGCYLVYLWLVEGNTPDRWDLIGAAVAVAGMGIIMFAPR